MTENSDDEENDLKSTPDQVVVSSTDGKGVEEKDLQSTRELEIEGDAHLMVTDMDLWYGDKQALYDVTLPLWGEVSDRLFDQGTGLSGGQQQRLCIARAIAVNPEVILMDEPCSALDPIATAAIEELILELKKDFTVVIVTHSMSQAARISDYTGFIYLGRLVEFGKTDQIFSNPKEKLTERYITGRFG